MSYTDGPRPAIPAEEPGPRRFAVARLVEREPRFFTGHYTSVVRGLSCSIAIDVFPRPEIGELIPETTARPDEARIYGERVVAELVAAFVNVLAGARSGVNDKPWIVAELPEAWT